jgi:hypothetical protein
LRIKKGEIPMPFKKILSIFTAIALLFLVGCQKEEANTDADTNSNADADTNSNAISTESQEIEATMPISYQTISVPEDKWVREDVVKTFYLFGHQFSEDFTIESLGKDFEIDEENSELYDDGVCYVFLKYRGESLGFCNIKCLDVKSLKEAYTQPIYYISIMSRLSDEAVKFNGIQIGSTKDEVLASFGTPTESMDSEYSDSIYYLNPEEDGVSLSFDFNEDNRLKSIMIG